MTWRETLGLGPKANAASRRDIAPPDRLHGPQEISVPGRSPVVTEVREKRRAPDHAPDVDQLRTDDVAEPQRSEMNSEGQGQHRDTHVTKEQSPVGVGVDAQRPNSMPRAEDDVTTRAGSREFHDHAGSGNDTRRRQLFFAPVQ